MPVEQSLVGDTERRHSPEHCDSIHIFIRKLNKAARVGRGCQIMQRREEKMILCVTLVVQKNPCSPGARSKVNVHLGGLLRFTVTRKH